MKQALDPNFLKSINIKEDMDKEIYSEMKELFYNIKQATHVQYLYTAKRADDGRWIYVIDGLDNEAKYFRYLGDPIEEEIVAALNPALECERVMPSDKKQTAWGNIFIAHMLIHGEDEEVIGAIGVELEAQHQYIIYKRLRQLIPVVILAACLLSAVTALILFRRLSNSHFQAMADSLKEAHANSEILYRIGGDEFVVLMPNATRFSLEAFVARLGESFDTRKNSLMPHASFSIG